MKVESMDAKNSNVQKPTVQNTPEKAVVQKNNKAKDVSPEKKKLGDISEYQKSELPVSEKVVIDAIEKANKAISGANKEFQFSIHSETKQILIKVLDKDTREVVGEFPSEKVLDMVAKITEKSGIMFDERG